MSPGKRQWRSRRRRNLPVAPPMAAPPPAGPIEPLPAVSGPSAIIRPAPAVPETLPIVAAIDFGTHGSGFAWARVGDLEENPNTLKINVSDQWPGSYVHYPKNLSALMLVGDKAEYWGFDARSKWVRAAAKVPAPNLSYVYAFKMALKPDKYRSSMPRGEGKIKVDTPQDAYPLIVAYLQEIRKVAISAITKTGYQEHQIRWCVTVPAIWEQQDRRLMRKAAVEAGFADGRLLLVQEPEAAALQCRVHMARRAADFGDEGTADDLGTDGARFVVVDCGGGTVDITAYRVLGPPGDDQRLMELCRASGGKLGSEYINSEFVAKVLTKHFGGVAVVDSLREQFPQDVREIVDKWEQEKVNLEIRIDAQTGEPHIADPVVITVPFPIGEYLRSQWPGVGNGVNHRIIVEPAEIEELFEVIVPGVLDEIEGRLDEVRQNAGPPPSGREILLLVGGFAGSEYLRERISRRFGKQVKIFVPDHPVAAVLFGAVRFCHRPGIIGSRRSRKTYGYTSFLPVEESADDQSRRKRNDEGEYRCLRFARQVQIGESVEVGKVTTTALYPMWEDQAGLEIRLLASTELNPRYPDSPGVEQIGSVNVDISESLGEPIAERAVTLEIRFGETEIQVECSNTKTGAPYKFTADFDYDIDPMPRPRY
jgi:hypothetical protein